MAKAQKPYPWFYTVNDRPVKFVQLPSGELDVLAWDFNARELVPNLDYLSAPFDPGKDVDELTEAEFERRLEALRTRR
jgi:hypothetical protein